MNKTTFLGLVCTEILHYFNSSDAVELLWLFSKDSLYFYHKWSQNAKQQGHSLYLILHYYVPYLHGQYTLRGFNSPASLNSPSPALYPFILPHPPLPWCNIFGTALQSTSMLKEVIEPGFGGLHCSYSQPCHARVARKKNWKGVTWNAWRETWVKEASSDNLLKHIPCCRTFNIMLLTDSLIHLLNCTAGEMEIRIKVLLQWIVNCAKRNSNKNDRDWKKDDPHRPE